LNAARVEGTMDGSRFDNLARATALSRRNALRVLAGAAAAWLGLPGGTATAQGNPFQRAGKKCANGQPCGSLAPCDGSVCMPIACRIGKTAYNSGDSNPENSCLYCIPGLDTWETWAGIAADGTGCAAAGGPCASTSGFCSAGECLPEPLADGTDCGDGLCCDGGACVECWSGCTIEGVPFGAGPHPDSDCLYCDPAVNPSAWTPILDGTACGGVAGRECCNGGCCAPDECCNGLACVPCCNGCQIDGECYEPFQGHPTIECLFCDPTVSETSWAPVAEDTPCGGVPGRVCCNGDCCSPTECCNGLTCEECGPHCHFGGVDIPAGTASANDPCLICDPERNIAGWSTADDGTECGFLQECCNGACCEAELCCRSDRTCDLCPCQIGDDTVEDGEQNGGNECQYCDSSANPDGWTSRPPGYACGANGDRECCDGDCCPSGQCCTLDGCGECLCEISGQEYPDEYRNDNCQICDVESDRFNWSTADDGERCGEDDTRECCGGECCPPGECCTDGECAACGCRIGTQTVAPDTVNEDNSCEICRPELNLFDWSPVTEGTACGVDGSGHCCARDCCASDECCILDACGSCICTIGNTAYPDQHRNTEADCQVCEARAEPFGWSEAGDNEPCRPESELVCCAGACCGEGECCIHGDCEECACTISDDEVVPEGTVNPDNSCELCAARENPDGWTVEPDGASCGPDLTQECCSGECCPVGECCEDDGLCAPCACTIGTETVPAYTRNPVNDCQLCLPSENRNGWTDEVDGTSCGPGGTMECCGGECEPSCLPPGCFIEGVFYVQGQVNPNNFCEYCDVSNPTAWSPVLDNVECPDPCFIDGEWVPGGTRNPDNECECCAPHLSETAWSPCDWLMCGESEEQHCCNSICCGADECCGDDLACTSVGCPPDACTIDGVEYDDGEENPLNSCQYCSLATSATSWTPKSSNTRCGPNGDQYCCNGQCCELGICCNPTTLVCDPTRCRLCAIGGRVYESGDRNPANLCEWCNPFVSTTTWSFVNANFYCNQSLQEGHCCNGFCCETDEFCRTSDFSCQPLS
jgi:hypothetical protein